MELPRDHCFLVKTVLTGYGKKILTQTHEDKKHYVGFSVRLCTDYFLTDYFADS